MHLMPDSAVFQKRIGALPLATYKAGETVLAAGSRTGRLLILKTGKVSICGKCFRAFAFGWEGGWTSFFSASASGSNQEFLIPSALRGFARDIILGSRGWRPAGHVPSDEFSSSASCWIPSLTAAAGSTGGLYHFTYYFQRGFTLRDCI
jgi:hypothetical protein